MAGVSPLDELRVRIESEDPLALAGLLALLRDRPGLQVLPRGGGRGDAAGVRPPGGDDADVILLDPGWKPLAEALGPLEEDGPPVLLLARGEDPDLPAGLPFGAVRGLLSRGADGETLALALTAVARGLLLAEAALQHAGGRAAGGRAPGGPGPGPLPAGAPAADPRPSLSPRERDVLRLIAEGLPNKAIAHRLGISEHTVKFHLNSLLAKLGAQSRTEAAVTAMRLGLLPL